MRHILARLLDGKYIESILLTNQQLSDTVADQAREIERLKKVNPELNASYGKVWNENQALRHKLEALQSDYDDLSERLETYKEEEKSLVKKFAEKKHKLEALQIDYANMQKEMLVLEKELKELRQDNADLRKRNMAMGGTIGSLRRKLKGGN